MTNLKGIFLIFLFVPVVQLIKIIVIGNTLAASNSFSSGIPVYNGVLIPGTLECHWTITELPLGQGRG